MCSSNWSDGEICELLTIMGEKVMQSHNEDGERYKIVPEYETFVGIKNKWSAK
jgi:hypothetical protein